MATLVEIRKFEKKLNTLDDSNDYDTRVTFQTGLQLLGAKETELAKWAKVNRSSAGRWKRGEAAPSPSKRGLVIRFLQKMIEQEKETRTLAARS